MTASCDHIERTRCGGCCYICAKRLARLLSRENQAPTWAAPVPNGYRGDLDREQLEWIGVVEPDEVGAWVHYSHPLDQLTHLLVVQPWEREVDAPPARARDRERGRDDA